MLAVASIVYVVVTVGEEEGSVSCLKGVPAHADTVLEMHTETAGSESGGDGKVVVFYVVIANFMLQKGSEIVNVGKFFVFAAFYTTCSILDKLDAVTVA